jgi:hypothetical protein
MIAIGGQKVCIFSGIILLIFLGCNNEKVNAQGTIGAGRFRPYVDLKCNYDSNIYSASEDEKGDFIVRATPGFCLTFEGYKYTFGVDLGEEFVLFTKYSEENRQNERFSSFFDLNFSKLSVKLEGEWRKGFSTTDSEVFSDYDLSRLSTVFTYEFNRLAFDLGYSNVAYDYERRFNYDDREYNIYSLISYLVVSPKTKVSLEYNRPELKYDYDPKRDGRYDQIRVCLDKELTGKLSGIIKAGYKHREYEHELRDWGKWVFSIGLAEKLSARASIRLNFERTAGESTGRRVNYSELERFSLALNRELPFGLEGWVGFYYEQEEYPETGEVDRSKGLSVGLRRKEGIRFK